MRTGDHVKHGPTGETWVVAYVDGDRMSWCGWPFGEAAVSDCTVVQACSDEEHASLLRSITLSRDGKRADMAKARLGLGATIMRKITPMPGACIEVLEDGTVQVRNWHIEGETDADDVTANGRVLAIIDWVRARAIAGANYSGDRINIK